MARFIIKQGGVWASNWFKWHWVLGWITTKKTLRFRIRVRLYKYTRVNANGIGVIDEVETPAAGQTMKITGLSDLSTRTNRVKVGGKRQRLSITHEDSDRVIGTFSGKGQAGDHEVRSRFTIRSYAYRSGRGAGTDPKHGLPSLSVLTLVESDQEGWSEWGTITIRRGIKHGRIREAWYGRADQADTVIIPLHHAPSLFQLVARAHANNGTSSSSAKKDIVFEIERIK